MRWTICTRPCRSTSTMHNRLQWLDVPWVLRSGWYGHPVPARDRRASMAGRPPRRRRKTAAQLLAFGSALPPLGALPQSGDHDIERNDIQRNDRPTAPRSGRRVPGGNLARSRCGCRCRRGCRRGCQRRCRGSATCAFRGWRGSVAAIGQMMFLFAAALEVRLIPAAAGQAEERSTDATMQLCCLARRADRGVGVGKSLQVIEAMPATAALKFVNGHENSAMTANQA